MNQRQRLSSAILLLSLQTLNAYAVECDGIDCPSDNPPQQEDCFDPQDPECPDDGGGFGPTYAVTGADVSTTESQSIVIGDDEDLYDGVVSNPTYEIITQPASGVATLDEDGYILFDPAGAFDALNDGEQQVVAIEYTVNDDDNPDNVQTGFINITVTGEGQTQAEPEEPIEEPSAETTINAGVITQDTLSRDGEFNDGEFVMVWMDTQRLAQGEALVIRNIPNHLKFLEVLSTDLPEGASGDLPFRNEVFGDIYRDDERIIRISPRSGDETSTPVVHVVFLVTATDSEENTALVIERLDSEGLEAASTTVEIPPAKPTKYYLEVARSNSGAILTAWPPATQEEDFVTLEATLSAETGSLTCSDTETLSGNGLLNGNGTATASCSDGIITASNTDARVSAEAPLTLPLAFTSEESTSLVTSGSISFSDASSISLEATAPAPEGAAVEPILIRKSPSYPYAALILTLPDSVEKATNLTVDLLLDPDSSETYPAQFDCSDIPTARTLNGGSLFITCAQNHVHIAFPVDMAVENQPTFEDGLARVDVKFLTSDSDGTATASVMTISKYDEIDSAVAYYEDYTINFEEDKESMGVFAALLALISFGLYRWRKQVS
ncbi:hypothetical protein SAMN05421686_1203 [Thalassolituus maritimus]|uniref:Cadherin domain-containing protein n=1 Tax=Thalassolituus maritimus TaxID=484498 RepID=A0A1N7QD70_9GAMM|nr:Ig-like domain-containing protein [Thalassolituus maritimus]SIT20517.1 hypothetical protein SAMN05421686_1203 [Thalassolituus maritimus]